MRRARGTAQGKEPLSRQDIAALASTAIAVQCQACSLRQSAVTVSTSVT